MVDLKAAIMVSLMVAHKAAQSAVLMDAMLALHLVEYLVDLKVAILDSKMVD
jgi:hypothetical protein